MFLPHWIFDIEVSVKYRGKVGFAAGDGKTEWMSVDAWKDGGTTKYDATNPAVQICASFKHRRDLVAAVTGPHVGKLPPASAKKTPRSAKRTPRGAPLWCRPPPRQRVRAWYSCSEHTSSSGSRMRSTAATVAVAAPMVVK